MGEAWECAVASMGSAHLCAEHWHPFALVACSSVPAALENQDEVQEKMQLNLAKRLLMCPYFNQRLKVSR